MMLPGVAKLFLVLGSINAMLAVMLGAFAAHGLKKVLSADLLTTFATGVQYHFYHAVGLIVVGLIAVHLPASMQVRLSGWFMLTGILLFSGSLYLLALTGVRWLGAITPFGGVCFIIAWVLLAVAVYKA
jgi:uncharacterized membrane protein YgdD (TMEM256/DUF423 family)